MGIGGDDVVLPVVPMFHAAAWGLPFAAVADGREARLRRGRTSIPSRCSTSWRTSASRSPAGVPTIWIGILAALDAEPKRWDLSAMRTMVIGGSAAPPALIDGFADASRPRGHARLGHDGDEPARHARAREAAPPTAARRSSCSRSAPRRASPCTFVEQRHIDETGKVLAVGRRDDGRARGARPVGRAVVLRRRGHGPLHRRTAGSRPATS